MTAPAISIIIPTHNRPELLNRAIESVLRQTFTDFEIAVIDDYGNATINSHDDRITVYRYDSGGKVARSRNYGIDVTTGKYIAFLDDDDYWQKFHLENGKYYLDRLGCGMYFTNMYNVSDIHETPTQKFINSNTPKLGNLLNFLILHPVAATPTVMIRRNVLGKAGVFSDDPALPVGEDIDMWLRIAAVTPAYFLPVCDVVRLYNPGKHDSLTAKNQNRGRASIAQFEATKTVFTRLMHLDIPRSSKALAMLQATNYQIKIWHEKIRSKLQ